MAELPNEPAVFAERSHFSGAVVRGLWSEADCRTKPRSVAPNYQTKWQYLAPAANIQFSTFLARQGHPIVMKIRPLVGG
jgi:hypothetical protein